MCPATPCPQRRQTLTRTWFRLFPVRSPLLGKSLLFSAPPGTKMFQFPGYGPHTLWIQVWVLRHYSQWVPPFGYPRIKACLRLPVAYRSSLRPSSPAGTKASTVCPCSLDLTLSHNNEIVVLSTNVLYFPLCSFQRTGWSFGGDERIRTADPLLARQVLSQLSYTPTDTYLSDPKLQNDSCMPTL